jgi:predicted dinucleotide-binding enzyme
MAISRTERLRVIQSVHEQWQVIYGDRDDPEAEAANYEMIQKALERAEADWAAKKGRIIPQ